MAAIDDVWEHAQTVRMWILTARKELGGRPEGFAARWLRRVSGILYTARPWFERDRDEDAAQDALRKAALANIDLQHALGRAGLPTLVLAAVTLDAGRMWTSERIDRQLEALMSDLARLDSLVEEVERLQKQARTPELR